MTTAAEIQSGTVQQRLAARSVRNDSGCLEWQGARNQYGYGVMGHGRKNFLSHRAAWMLAHGDIPAGLHVCHKCDNPQCVEPSHLFLGTAADNCADKISKGRMKWGNNPTRGEKSTSAKLTTEQVLAIRSATGPQTEIARQYGIAQQTVSDLKRGKKWRHLN